MSALIWGAHSHLWANLDQRRVGARHASECFNGRPKMGIVFRAESHEEVHIKLGGLGNEVLLLEDVSSTRAWCW